MPLKLDIQKLLTGRSERVKSVDIHPKEPWILAALFTGNVLIWNYETEVVVRSFEISEVPVRSAKFIPRKNWFVCGADDMNIRVYNYNTCEKVKEWEAHADYIRSICVHPILPFILSTSDDMSIKLWDWDKNWENTMIFEGHVHYVMQVEINPKDHNSFCSASLDRSIKIWGLNSPQAHFQLEGHEKGINCISYYQGGERPFLVSGADDYLVKIWDYQTKTCIATLEGHTNNISSVMFHPQLPIIISGSEDGSVKIWHSTTYRLETTLNYSMERVWTLSCMHNSNKIAIGFDLGTMMIKLGQEEPVVSMDAFGKVIWARNHEVQIINLIRISQQSILDGETLPISPDDLGSVEYYPSLILHNKNGQLVTVCGDGEYTIYTALKLKNKAFGSALDFVWSDQPSVYATRESESKIKIFSQFKEHKALRLDYEAKAIFGGHLLAVSSKDFVDFYSWNDGRIIRRIEAVPNKIYWSDGGSLVAVVCDDCYYILRYNEEVVDRYISQNIETDQQGIELAFDLEHDITETVTSGHFTGEIFIYTTSNNRLNYYVGGQIMTLTHLDRPYFILGYLHNANRVFLIDKRYNIVSFELLRYLLAYQAAIVRGDMELANTFLAKKKIPEEHFNKIAEFLEKRGYKEMALAVSKDPEHRFELALSLKKLNMAKQILLESPSFTKWKQLGDLAMQQFDFQTVEECAINAQDLTTLLLLYTSISNKNRLEFLSKFAIKLKRFDIAFQIFFIIGRPDYCIQLLLTNNKIPEAAFMARTFQPNDVDRIQQLWKKELSSISPAAAKSLGDRTSHPEHFQYNEYYYNNNNNLENGPTVLSPKQQQPLLQTNQNKITKHEEEKEIEIEKEKKQEQKITSNKIESQTLSQSPIKSKQQQQQQEKKANKPNVNEMNLDDFGFDDDNNEQQQQQQQYDQDDDEANFSTKTQTKKYHTNEDFDQFQDIQDDDNYDDNDDNNNHVPSKSLKTQAQLQKGLQQQKLNEKEKEKEKDASSETSLPSGIDDGDMNAGDLDANIAIDDIDFS